MKHKNTFYNFCRPWLGRIFLGLTFTAATLSLRFAAAETASKDSDRIVVMISVDGLAAYYIDDPKAEMPTIRALAVEGARASMMKASTPTVTWPNHTTLVTGVPPAKHGVVGNNYLNRETGEKVKLITDPVFDKDQIVKVPTIYDVAKAAGMKTAAIRWPASRNAKSLDWTMPDMATADELRKYTTPSLADECKAAGIDLFEIHDKNAGKDEPPDDMYAQMFDLILHQNRPNLALLHIARVDHDEHMFGPKSPEAYLAVKKADNQVRQVWEELKRDYPDKATLIVVSDHGFSPIKRMILPNVLLRKAGLVDTKKKGAVEIVSQGGAALLYICDEKSRAEIMGKVRRTLSDLKGISKIISGDQMKEYGVADYQVDPHAPDMILFADEGCTFGDTAAGELPFNEKPERKGSHGHDPNLPDLHATFVAWGAGIKPGTKLGEISNVSVAPTIAKLLHLTLPNVEEKPLTAILAE